METITADYILVGDLRETGMSREKDIGHQQNYQNHQSEHSRQTSIKKTTEPYLRVLYNFQLSSLNFDIFQLLVDNRTNTHGFSSRKYSEHNEHFDYYGATLRHFIIIL